MVRPRGDGDAARQARAGTLRPVSNQWRELDEKGRPSFEEIQQRMGLTSESEIRRKMKVVPVTYMVFDLIWQDGHALFEVPYAERRRRLAALKLAGPSWQTPPFEKGGGPA